MNLESIKPKEVGDDVSIDFIHEYLSSRTENQLKRKFLRGKLIIIDFISSTCVGCIREIPKLDSLQKNYNSQVQFVVVSSEGREKFQRLYERKLIPRDFTVPILFNDTVLTKIFPHRLFPHKVWISPKGTIKAITDSKSLSTDNIQKVLNSSEIDLPIKKDLYKYEPTKSLLETLGGVVTNAEIQYTLITGFVPGTGSGKRVWQDSSKKKIVWLNRPLLSMYQEALKFPSNRVVVEVPERERIFSNDEENLFCVEMVVPTDISEEDIQTRLVQQLNEYTGFSGAIESRNVACYVLDAIDTSLIPAARTPAKILRLSPNHAPKIIRNYPLAALVSYLNSKLITDPKFRPIVVDETEFRGMIELSLNVTDIHNLYELDSQLRSFGLRLLPAERTIDMFVLSNKSNP